jgi:site-specific recombinase XerD
VSLFIDTGIRLNELAGLRLGDIDRSMRVLLVHRKGNKWQQVPVSRDGFKPLHDYLMKHRPYLAKLGGVDMARKEDAVFLNSDGEPLAYWGVAALWQRLKRGVLVRYSGADIGMSSSNGDWQVLQFMVPLCCRDTLSCIMFLLCF